MTGAPSGRERPPFADILGPSGPLSREPFYEHRPGQILLAEEAWEAFREGRVLIAEAGTGTGKSLSYLLPAAFLGSRVVISTGTKALQDQLLQKDIPLLESLIGRRLRAVLVKGRANYLCLYHYHQFVVQPLLESAREARFLKKLGDWAGRTKTGDKAEWRGIPEDLSLWRDISARREHCLGGRCPLYEDCFLVRLRCEAEAADLVVVNHHLLFADLVIKREWEVAALPAYTHLVLDEAHQAEGAAISYFGVSVSRRSLQELLGDVGRAQGRALDPALAAAIHAAQEAGGQFFDSLGDAGERRAVSRDSLEGAQRDRWEGMECRLESLACALETGRLGPAAEGLLERLAAFREDLSFVLEGQQEDFVRWCEVRAGNATLGANPIEVGPLLREALFDKLRAAVLTSATLTVAGNFRYIRESLGVPREARDLQIESPFDFQSQGLLFVPERFPEPSSPGFRDAFLETVLQLVRLSRGRAFVLCTSLRNMEAAGDYLAGRCGYPVLVQGSESKTALMERFRGSGQAVLVASLSFWQGVDVQGEALSLVVLDKLPFAVPSDPLQEARARLLRERGEDPFHSFQLPAAAILVKQGAGRLIRSSRDRGVVACLDGRIRSRSYGQVILESLPPFRTTSDMAEVKAFFAEEFEK